jgi:hypothetical protein
MKSLGHNITKHLHDRQFIFLLLAFIAVLIDLTLFNWFHTEAFLNCDFVADGIKSVRAIYEHGLLFNEYAPSLELGQSRPWFITLPAYLVTDSWLSAYKITQIVTSLLIIGMLSLLMFRLGIKAKTVLFADIIMVGINFGTINSFRFTYVYSVFVILTLLFLILYIDVFICNLSGRRLLKMSAMLIISFVGGIFGTRFTLMLALPILIIEIIRFFRDMRGNNESILHAVLTRKSLIFSGIVLVANFCGLILYRIYSTQTYDNSSGFVLQSVQDVINDIPISFAYIFQQLCVYGNVQLGDLRMSGELVLRLLVYAIAVGGGIWIFRNREIFDRPLQFALSFFSMSIALMFAVVTVTTMNDVARYFVLVWYLVIIVIAVLFERIETKLYRIIFIFSAFMLVLLSLTNNEWLNPNSTGLHQQTHRQVLSYLDKNDFDVIYATYWNSSILEGLSDGTLKTAHFFGAGEGFSPHIWLTDALLYYDNSVDDRKIAVVFTDEEETTFLSAAPQVDLDQLTQAEKIAEIADRNIYQFDFNPVTAFKMPIFKGQTEEYFFSKRYATKVSDNISYNGRYIDCSAEGTVAWGPYVKANRGVYRITVNYEYLKYAGPCTFLLTSQAGAEIVSQTELPKEAMTFILPDVELKETKDLLEFVVTNPSQSIIRLKSVVVEKIK